MKDFVLYVLTCNYPWADYLRNPRAVTHLSVLFAIFLIFGLSLPALSGLLVFPFSLIPNSLWQIYRILLSVFFLALALAAFFYGSKTFRKYWQVLLAFFIAIFALNLQAISGSIQSTTMDGQVLAMLSSTVLVVVPIIVLTRISGGNMYSIFLTKGKLRSGLFVGLISFLVFAGLSIPGANYLFKGQNLTINRLVSWMPWILPIVLANGLREELLYRGLFLKKFESLLGNGLSGFLQALIFSLSHSVAGFGTVSYTSSIPVLVVATFLLGLASGYIMQRTDSIIGSILLHAGTDIPIFIGTFSNL